MRRLLPFVVLFAACGGSTSGPDQLVGDPCGSDRDCEVRCYSDSDKFPGGFCSLPCASDADCPDDTVCVDTSGGVCLFSCAALDCAFLGGTYRCDDKDHRGGGTVFVCIGD